MQCGGKLHALANACVILVRVLMETILSMRGEWACVCMCKSVVNLRMCVCVYEFANFPSGYKREYTSMCILYRVSSSSSSQKGGENARFKILKL